jgi:hypothetical protein
MRKRCNNSGSGIYRHYGGRGIRVCERWDDFAAFLEDMEPTWAEGLTLDRIDVNGNYEPANVRWATKTEQANNRRDNIIVPPPAAPMPITLASRTYGVSTFAIRARIDRGWPASDLLLPPGTKRAA